MKANIWCSLNHKPVKFSGNAESGPCKEFLDKQSELLNFWCVYQVNVLAGDMKAFVKGEHFLL